MGWLQRLRDAVLGEKKKMGRMSEAKDDVETTYMLSAYRCYRTTQEASSKSVDSGQPERRPCSGPDTEGYCKSGSP